jgi:hypothetical protein
MANAPWDPDGEALTALRMIAADPRYGAEALSSTQTMTNLLKDLLPDAPREANVLIAATGAGLAPALQQYAAQGMDPGTASRLAAGTLADRTSLTGDACAWVTSSLVSVLFPPEVRPGATAGAEVPATGPTARLTSPISAGPGPRRRTVLGLLAACVAGAGALATIAACGFSYLHVYNPDGTYAYSESLFSVTSHHGGAWYWAGPVVAAALAVVAALVLMVSRSSWLRGAAAGAIAAFGVAIGLFFAAYQFTLGPVSSGAGPAGAEKLGAFGGLLLLAAGLLGVAAAAQDRSVATW